MQHNWLWLLTNCSSAAATAAAAWLTCIDPWFIYFAWGPACCRSFVQRVSKLHWFWARLAGFVSLSKFGLWSTSHVLSLRYTKRSVVLWYPWCWPKLMSWNLKAGRNGLSVLLRTDFCQRKYCAWEDEDQLVVVVVIVQHLAKYKLFIGHTHSRLPGRHIELRTHPFCREYF